MHLIGISPRVRLQALFHHPHLRRIVGLPQGKQDVELAAQMIEQIAMLFPGCPASEVADIAEHTARRGSGRVGRTEAGRNLERKCRTLAVVAAIRHKHTRYDELFVVVAMWSP